MTAGFGNAPLIKNDGFLEGDATDDKTNGRFERLFTKFLSAIGATFTAGVIDNLTIKGGLYLSTLGEKIHIKSGAGASTGSATLVAGTIAVAKTDITASSIVMYSRKTIGGTVGDMSYTVSAGVGFTLNSSSNTDTSVINYLVIEPIA